MKCKIVTVLIVSVVASFVCGRMLFAQYTGGIYDGYAMGSFTASLSMPVTTGYTGGNGDGYAKGSFAGSLWMSTVTTSSATNVTANSATLNGMVNAHGTSTMALFQYGANSGIFTGTSSTTSISTEGTSTVSEASFTTTASSGGGGGGGGTKYTLTVSSTSPSSGATGAGTSTAITATFSMYMNGSTLAADTFKLWSDSGDVSGSVTTYGATATFTPASSLSYDTVYTAMITTKASAANAAGTTLDANYSWSFTTETAPIVLTPTPASTVTPASTPSPTPVASPTPAITPTQPADMSLSKAVAYLSGDTVAVMVVDADRDSNATSEDTLTTALKVTALNYYAGGDLILDLKENAVNSGTFLATIKTGTVTTGGASVSSRGTVPRAHYFNIKTETATSVGASSSVRSNIGTIKTVQGGTATVVYTDTAPNASTIIKTLSFYCSDATLVFDAESFTVGSYAVVTHVDAEENSDHTQEDTLLNHAVIEILSIGHG